MIEPSEVLQSQELSNQHPGSTNLSIDQIVDRIATLLQNEESLERKEYETLHAAFYKRKKQLETSDAPYDKEHVLLQEARLNDLNQQFRSIEKKRTEHLVALQLENGTKAEELLNELEVLLSSPEDFKHIYDRFHIIRGEWESLRPLTQQDESRLGKRYVSLRESFYELKNINTEMRDYDFRKNLELKQGLLEEMRQAEAEEDCIVALNKLTPLLVRWRDVGPVARDLRDNINERFKSIKTSIFKRHQAYQESLKQGEEERTAKKLELIEHARTLVSDLPTTPSGWNSTAEELKKLQKDWQALGYSGKSSSSLYMQLREVCDRFFGAKQEYFRERKTIISEAITQRKALISEAIETAKGEHYKETVEALTRLQERWQKLPGIRKEEGDALWAEFRKPFEEFYKRKREHDREQSGIRHHNEAQKQALLEELRALLNEEELPDHLASRLSQIKDKWRKIGRAGSKVNDTLWADFCRLNDELYDRLRSAKTQGKIEQIKARHQKIAGDPSKVKDELTFLQRKVERLKGELRNYDNNLTFLTSSSKDNNNPLIKEATKKRLRLAQDIEQLEREIKLIRELEN